MRSGFRRTANAFGSGCTSRERWRAAANAHGDAVLGCILLFALDELRARYGHLTPPGSDARHDTAAFRAFRTALLGALAPAAQRSAQLSMWWEGGFNGYALAVAIDPHDAVPGCEEVAARAARVEESRVDLPRRDSYPMARLTPAAWEIARDDKGWSVEAPFGSATGHFGAPGMKKVAPGAERRET